MGLDLDYTCPEIDGALKKSNWAMQNVVPDEYLDEALNVLYAFADECRQINSNLKEQAYEQWDSAKQEVIEFINDRL